MAKESLQIGVVAPALSNDPREAVRLSRQLGFNGLQFDGRSSSVDLTQLSGSGRREFRRMLAGLDQQLIGLRADAGKSGFGPSADVDRAISAIDSIMEAATGLGAPLVCVDIGPLPAAPRTKTAKPKVTPGMAGLILLPEPTDSEPEPIEASPPPDRAFVGQVTAAMDALGRGADRYSVRLAFRSELASFASLKQAVLSVNCPWFGIDLDPLAMLRDDWNMDEIFTQLGPLIRHVRGRDALIGSEHRTKPADIGQGNVNWQALLANLDQAGYRGWITTDPIDLPERTAAAASGRAYLWHLLGRPER
jgi:sugar phosphate isomerase/epimerase